METKGFLAWLSRPVTLKIKTIIIGLLLIGAFCYVSGCRFGQHQVKAIVEKVQKAG